MEVSSHIHGPVAVPQVKETGFGVAKNLLPLLEFEPRYVQSVTYLLYRLRYPDF